MKSQRKDDHVKTEGEIGLELPHAMEGLGPPAAARGKEGTSPRGSEGPWLCRLLNFRLLASRTVRP